MSDLLSIIAPDHRDAVKQAFIATFNDQPISTIAPLAGGLSSAPVYLITVGDQRYVLKLEPGSSGALTSSANLKLASDAGVAPTLYYLDQERGVSISAFIASQQARTAFTPDALAVELAGTIRAIHAVPCPPGGHPLRELVDGLIGTFRQGSMLTGPVIDEVLAFYELLRAAYPWGDSEKVFSHNDLNPSNVLSDGKRIWVIDWNTAFANDRYVDLAAAANFFIHTEQGEKLYLATYFSDDVNEYRAARFFLMRQVCRLIYAAMMLQLASRQKPTGFVHDQQMEGISLAEVGPMIGSGKLSLASYEGQFLYGKALWNAALHQMRSPRFATSLECVRSSIA